MRWRMARVLSDHPDYHQLLRRVAAIVVHGGPLRELVFRCSEPTYATKDDLLTGKGSRRHVGYWLTGPNDAFDGDAPADSIAKGKVDLLWRMIFELRSGVSS